MPAKSKKQQKFFGMVHQCQKPGGKCASPEVKKVAKDIDYEDADKFASTKHKGLPEKKKKKMRENTFPTWTEWLEWRKSQIIKELITVKGNPSK